MIHNVTDTTLHQEAGQTCPSWITIWVPGTHPDELIIPRAAKLIDEKAYHNLFTCPHWIRAQDYDHQHHFYALAHTLAQTDPNNFPFEHIYLSGWSGKLDFAERTKSASELFNHITQLQQTYRARYGAVPRIRIITHSHGGNVALNMAKCNNAETVIIDELILLACPVQKETAQFVHHAMFKKIYSLHSHLDMIQVLDPQGWHDIKTVLKQFFTTVNFDTFKELFSKTDQPFFSERHFTAHAKLIQADIRTKYRGLLHIEFKLLPFIKKLPHVIKHLESQLGNNNHEISVHLNSL